MLIYDLSEAGSVPKYIYLYMCIKNDILSGKLKPGERLPSKRTMAQQHNLGVVTVANCYEQLLSEGYIVSYERSGYYVEELSELPLKSARISPAAENRSLNKKAEPHSCR